MRAESRPLLSFASTCHVQPQCDGYLPLDRQVATSGSFSTP